MSKTDKTQPFLVKVRDHGVEHHDHRKGYCDLPSDPKEFGWRGMDHCYVDAQWWHPIFRCCCPMCSGSAMGYGPKDKARKVRREGRRQCREWEKEW